MNEELIEPLKQELIRVGRSLFERGLTPGASANMSVRFDGGFIVTPTNSCIGFLDSERLSVMDDQGFLVSGDAPSKEFLLHRSFYDNHESLHAVIHLHSTWATALSCLTGLNADDAVQPLTPYLTMRLGAIGTVPYFAPGDTQLVQAVKEKTKKHAGVLMENHGPIVAAGDIVKAMYAIEELEESCKLQLMLQSMATKTIPANEIAYLKQKYQGKL